MNITITWNPGDTWRKLGYYYYTNSLDYRAVLAQNPQWSVTKEPPVGTVLSLNVNESRTLSTTTNQGFFWDEQNDAVQAVIFPFDFPEQYESQISKYSLYALMNNNELNGYTMDTVQAQTGKR